MIEIERKQWFSRSLLFSLFLMALIAVWSFLGKLNTPVNVVKIDGSLGLEQRSEIAHLIQPQIARGFLGLDMEQLVGSLQSVSWVRGVEARKEWPGTLYLRVLNQSLVARWGDDMFLNNTGSIVGGGGNSGTGLPQLSCHHATGARAMRVYETLRQALEPSELRIKSLMESESGEWSLVLHNGVEVILGSNHLLARIEKFIVVYRDQLANGYREFDTVDARYVSGVAVHWKVPVERANKKLLAVSQVAGSRR